MNPSYSNSVDDANSGGTNPQVPPNPAAPAQGAAGSAATPQPQQSPNSAPFAQVQPIISTSPVSPNAPISSGTGDIILGGGAPEKKSRKGLIVLIVLVAILVLIGGGFLLWKNGTFGGGNNAVELGQVTPSMEDAYNSYANYVLLGKDSTDKISYETLFTAQSYFNDLSADERDTYLEKEAQKYSNLKTQFVNYTGDTTLTVDGDGNIIKNDENTNNEEDIGGNTDINIDILKTYFHDLVAIEPLTTTEIIQAYTDDGEKAVGDLINERYVVNEGETSDDFKAYLEAEKNLANIELEIIKNANAANCIQGDKLVEGCHTLTSEEETKIKDESNKVSLAVKVMYFQAKDTLEVIHDLIYGVDEKYQFFEENIE